MPAPRRKRALRITLGVLLALVGYLVFQSISIHRFGFSNDGRAADCAVILGAAAYHNKPSPVFTERINQGIRLYKEKRVRHLILTGGYGQGAPFAESEVALKYCLDHGVPREALLLETKSQTTGQNLAEAKALMDTHGWRTALIVSDPWHLKRAVAIARDLGIDAHPSGTVSTRYESPKARAGFLLRELYFYHQYLLLGH